MNTTIQTLFSIAKESGAAILDIYKSASNDIDYKQDNSPLTIADKKSNEIIVNRLQEHFPGIPVLSEESATIPHEERKNWEQFWLVDPLDGTKEFIKKSGEFTINIALVENDKPVTGLIHVPVKNITYFAYDNQSYRVTGDSLDYSVSIQVRKASSNRLTVVASRDHAGEKVKNLLEKLPDAATMSMGSSLKFCLVAEGAADLYYRDVPTMEWATAAAQAIVEAAGGAVLTEGGEPLVYNKNSLKNPELITVGETSFNWSKFLKVKEKVVE